MSLTNDKDILADRVIKELGGNTVVSKLVGKTPQAISLWLRRGIPRSWELYLRERFPNLQAWQSATARGQTEVSVKI